ncbi:GDSL-like lipase/acylhydrolase family protein [Mucilaginibacter gracilis]|uniref:GDSL-like lipase/acylhydrolase family protein n=2 Tax=Mucilaginibacter gracilis TaxID=423350 RepID=A0A495J3W3_9SPHI|nr:GDSL-like lipase/acylhydrolase family protein [Mucilaginibacter gracilis]
MFWYEDEVKRLEAASKQIPDKRGTIFYGSSTIRLWDSLSADLPALNPVNLGFGGSTLAACVWFFNRIMQDYQPKQLIVYAGDNDLGDGRHPEEVYIFFKQLVVVAQERFGNLPCYFISLKPSPTRWNIAEQFKSANQLISTEITTRLPNWQYINLFADMLGADGKPKRELFLDDGLHLSKLGYAVWKTIIAEKTGAQL